MFLFSRSLIRRLEDKLPDNLHCFRYVVSYENPDAVVRLTQLGYCHTVEMDKVCEA